MKLLFATTNPHKFEEIQALLTALPIELLGLSDLEVEIPEPQEDGATLAENARIKALVYAAASGLPCLADDSGLEADALGGAPGVRSARYAEFDGPRAVRDEKNRQRLLAELRKLGDARRSARLVCTLCLATSSGEIVFETRGIREADIIDEPRGSHGFGYDVLLYLPDVGKTAAELLPSEWNRISHRAMAAKHFCEWFSANNRSA